MTKALVQLLLDDQILNKYKIIFYEAGTKVETAFEASMRDVIEMWNTDPEFRENWLKPFRSR